MNTVLLTLLGIYSLGVLCTLCLGMCAFATLVATRPIRYVVRQVTRLAIITLLSGICWPWLLFKNTMFREVVLDLGGMGVIMGYVLAALLTPVYPWIWAWYLASVGAFLALRHYHECRTLTDRRQT